MKKDQNPIDVEPMGKFQITVSGAPFPFPNEMIPKLFVAYVAALRADYYATGDDARTPGCFDDTFHDEIRNAMRHRGEIKDWMENNMDVHLEPADEIEIALLKIQ